MNIAIDDVFAGIARADYERLFFDEDFNAALGRAQRLGRQLLQLDRTPERIVRRVCFEPAQPDDAPVKQAFGSSRASFVEELDYDVRAGRGTWRTIPNRFADRVTNAGTIEIADWPAGGTRRSVRGDVTVRLLGFGRRIERMIHREIEKSFAATTAFTREWLRTRPSP